MDYRSGFTSPTEPVRSPRRLLGAVGAVALAVALSGTVAAGSATAQPAGCAVTKTFDFAKIQIDNCAVDGHQSWAWIYAGNAAKIHFSSVTVTLETGVRAEISADRNKTNSEVFTQRIVSAKICEFVSPPFGFPRIPLPSCGVDIPF